MVRTFYVTNATSAQEFQEIATAIRTVADIRRVFTYTAQKAMVIRGSLDAVALAEKVIHDLDKPKSEVIVDVIVMQANSARNARSGGEPGECLRQRGLEHSIRIYASKSGSDQWNGLEFRHRDWHGDRDSTGTGTGHRHWHDDGNRNQQRQSANWFPLRESVIFRPMIFRHRFLARC